MTLHVQICTGWECSILQRHIWKKQHHGYNVFRIPYKLPVLWSTFSIFVAWGGNRIDLCCHHRFTPSYCRCINIVHILMGVCSSYRAATNRTAALQSELHTFCVDMLRTPSAFILSSSGSASDDDNDVQVDGSVHFVSSFGPRRRECLLVWLYKHLNSLWSISFSSY